MTRERFRIWLPFGRLTDALGLGVKKGIPALGGIRLDERHVDKVGRNGLCPCGSGKKFKKCHGGRGLRGELWKVEERLRGYDEST
ncbi:MAG TPA: SEC-C metal-binding domain-containing protein [Acidimicrobiales bacterium]|nr:SEC-C metal-binding domain-containing protein [Acidimicrobiales bacterium]